MKFQTELTAAKSANASWKSLKPRQVSQKEVQWLSYWSLLFLNLVVIGKDFDNQIHVFVSYLTPK